MWTRPTSKPSKLIRRFSLFAALTLGLAPLGASAAVVISEVMYDPPGADDGHEWIEVYNDGAPADLTKWKVFEGGSNHGIASYAGSATLGTGAYAVVADNPAKFLADYPGFSGQVFDTAFSAGLSNAGEAVSLKDGSLAIVDTVQYDPSRGAAGDGATLQKVGGSWAAAPATPGTPPGGASEETNADTAGGSASSTPDTGDPITDTAPQDAASTTPPVFLFPTDPQITVTAGSDRTVVVGADAAFSAHVADLSGNALPDARVIWNFGDGETREGTSVLYAFPFPGTYAAIVEASGGYNEAITRFTVIALPADVAISDVDASAIEIENRSVRELDIGRWQLSADGKTFLFPPHTIIFPHEAVRIADDVSGIIPSSPQAVTLEYPNGTLAAAYAAPLIAMRISLEASSSKALQGASAPEAFVDDRTPASSSEDVPSGASVTLTPSSAARTPVAAPAAALPLMRGIQPFLPWILGAMAVIALSLAGVLLRKRDESTKTGYTITEEKP